MSNNIPFTLSNVAETAIAPINADATLATTSSSNEMIFAGVTVASKGQPFQALSVTKDNWQSVFGKPLHSSVGLASEGLRHIGDAVEGGNGIGVRVVPETATYPVIRVAPIPPYSASKTPIKNLGLESDLTNKLLDNGVSSIEALQKLSTDELGKMGGIGKASLAKIDKALSEPTNSAQLTIPVIVVSDVATDNIVDSSEATTIVISGTTTDVEDDQVATITVENAKGTIVWEGEATVSTNAWSTAEINMNAFKVDTYTIRANVDDFGGDSAVEATKDFTVLDESPTITISGVGVDNSINPDESDSVVIRGAVRFVEQGQTVTVNVVDSKGQNVHNSTTTVEALNLWGSDPIDMSDWEYGDYTATADVDNTDGDSARKVLKSFVLNEPDPVYVITNEAIRYGESVELEEDDHFALFIKDGADSDNRQISLEPANAAQYGDGMLELKLTETDSVGYTSTLETHYVSMTEGATDDMGNQVFIETVLESSNYLGIECGVEMEAVTLINDVAFTGASNGNISDITTDDYLRAVNVLKAHIGSYTGVCALGCYDEAVISALIDVANRRRIGFYGDANPRFTYDQAATWKEGLALNEHRAVFSHIPFTCKDPYYGNRNIWGLSGVLFAAKAAGVAKHFSPGGWHYTPAGEERAIITRTNVKPIAGLDEPDYERMYTCRLNKLGLTSAGQLFIDDSLTSYTRENYLRFEQQVSVPDAVGRDAYALCARLKHNPDGIVLEGLTEGLTDILDGYVQSRALVTPRNPDEDGTEPYVLYIEQPEVDLWIIRYALCVTGSARRFMCEPVLIR